MISLVFENLVNALWAIIGYILWYLAVFTPNFLPDPTSLLLIAINEIIKGNSAYKKWVAFKNTATDRYFFFFLKYIINA